MPLKLRVVYGVELNELGLNLRPYSLIACDSLIVVEKAGEFLNKKEEDNINLLFNI